MSESSSSRFGFGIIDRLTNLRSQDPIDDSVPLVSPSNVNNSEDIKETLSKVEILTNDINTIKQYVRQITENHIKVISSFQNEDARKEIEALQTKLKELSHQVTDELIKMKQEIERDEKGPNRNTADFRIKKAHYSTLSRNFHDTMMEYNKEEDKYRDMNEDKIRRQLQIAGKNVTDEEIESILMENMQSFATQSILDKSLLTEHQQVLTEVEMCQKEIMKLEENIKELHDMFYDLSQLVQDQGDLIDQIEHNVYEAEGFVDEGVVAISTATDYAERNRKILLVTCVVIFVIIAVVVLVIGAVIIGVILSRQRFLG